MSNHESKISACSGFSVLPSGGGTRATMASRTSSTPSRLFALISKASSAGIASTVSICSFAKSGCAAGKSILLITGRIVRLWPAARKVFATVWASTPWLASTTSSAPSHAERARETSYEKSTCPGVSIKFRSEEHTSELQSQSNLVCRLLLEKKKKHYNLVTFDKTIDTR